MPDLVTELDNLLYRADENGWWTSGHREVRRTVQHNGGDISYEARLRGRRFSAPTWYSQEALTFHVPGLGLPPYAEYAALSRPWQARTERRRVTFAEAAHLLSQPVHLSAVHNGT